MLGKERFDMNDIELAWLLLMSIVIVVVILTPLLWYLHRQDRRVREDNVDAERPALEDFAHTVSGAAQLLDSMVHSTRTPPELRAALDLLCNALNTTAKKANVLIDEIGIDLSQSLGVSTTDLAEMHFAPVTPTFHRTPSTAEAWGSRAQSEFMLWGAVETLLAEDDAGLERRFNANPDEHLAMVDALEKLRERWLGEVKLLEASLLRLAVVVARWEQSGGH